MVEPIMTYSSGQENVPNTLKIYEKYIGPDLLFYLCGEGEILFGT